jgi:hypothetical protein
MTTEFPHLQDFTKFVQAREDVRLRKEAGQPWPWSSDPILQQYRFCNIQREADYVTDWLRVHWREPHKDDPHLWFAMSVARFINQPSTLERLGWPVPFSPDHMRAVMSEPNSNGESLFRAAYMVRSEASFAGQPKIEYLILRQFLPYWLRRDEMAPHKGELLTAYHARLTDKKSGLYGMGSFMAGQLIADLKFAPPLNAAADWDSFAVPGPGSMRGLNFIMGREMNAPWTDAAAWREAFDRLRPLAAERLAPGIVLSASDTQNALCEWHKYRKAQLGLGRPKQRYRAPEPREPARSRRAEQLSLFEAE